jgi:hypothetical protein
LHYFRRQGFSDDIVQFPETDFAAIARGYRARGATVRTLTNLDAGAGVGRGGRAGTAKSIRISKPTGTPSIFHRERPINSHLSFPNHPRDAAGGRNRVKAHRCR